MLELGNLGLAVAGLVRADRPDLVSSPNAGGCGWWKTWWSVGSGQGSEHQCGAKASSPVIGRSQQR